MANDNFATQEIGIWTSVSDGRENIGSSLNRGEFGVEAYDADDVLLGVFADGDRAFNAICDRWDSRSNGDDADATAGEKPGLPGEPNGSSLPRPDPDRSQLEAFVPAMFKHATPGKYVSLRAFYQDRANSKPFKIRSHKLNGNLDALIDQAYRVAEFAAFADDKVVFCPPIATFNHDWRARQEDLAEGLALSVECDAHAQAARIRLEELLGPATVVVESGGTWTDPETGKSEPKLHLHYRLKTPASSKEAQARLKEARRLATKIVGGDSSNVPLVHPIRWPGSVHRKGDQPKLCRIIELNPDAEIDLDTALDILRTAAGESGGRHGNGNDAVPVENQKIVIAPAFAHLDPNQNVAEGIEHRVADIAEIRSAADAIPPAAIADEPDWMQLARALAWEAKQRPERRDSLWEILDAVSRRAPNYDQDNNRRKFDRYIDEAGEHEKPTTIATLFYMALQHGWQGGGHSAAELERRAEQIAENIRIGDDVTEPLLPQIMTLDEMHHRLVFIGSTGGVADRATGRIRKKEHAADEYAASKHISISANGNPKKGSALKLWIASKNRMTVEVLTWVPGKAQICQPPEGPGPAFNMWRGLTPIAYPEDWRERAEPFLEHVEYLVPNEAERERFLQWFAHIVQHPEVLPHTAYLMTTPTTGIGRNLLASIIVRALRGFVAAGISLPELLDGGYTGRLSKKLLAIVDEAREGSGERRYQRATRLTSLLNEEHRHINPKYGHQSVEKNCCRWLMFSNYDDAIPFDNADRRIIVIANPTVRKEDAYYARLYSLLNDNTFIGSVRHWLETKDIANFRPGEHAPMNPAKVRVLNEMMSEIERAVAEFKEDCQTELTSRSEIKSYVGSRASIVNDTHLTYAIRRAGMVNTGRRIQVYKNDNGLEMENRLSVVIVRGEWTVEIVKRADPMKLIEAMGLKVYGWSVVKQG
jgi:hypothetical protein